MKCKILFVDDEEDFVNEKVEELQRVAVLNRDNVQVLPAIDVSVAKQILLSTPIDAVITDYYFPSGMSGDQLIDAIQDPFHTKLVVLMSRLPEAKVGPVIRKRHKNLGNRFRFLRKNFDSLELKAKYLEIERFFLDLPYPFPLEYARQHLSTPITGASRISVTKDLIESFLKYSTAIIMSDLADRGYLNVVKLKFQLFQELTLGAWVQWFKSAMDAWEANGEMFMPELQQLFAGDPTYSNMIYRFKNYRNDLFHGFTVFDPQYENETNTYAGVVHSFMRDLNFLARYPVFVPLHVDFATDDENTYVYDAKILMGTDAVLPQTQFRSRQRLPLRRAYCYGPEGRCISLYPFVNYTMCSSCGVSKFYMLDRVMESECSYNAVCNHRFSDKQARAEFEHRIKPVLSHETQA